MIHIPQTIDEAVSTLNGLGRLLIAKEWERAAIVYAFTRDGEDSDKNMETRRTNSGTSLLAREFAALGIAGLKSHNTVRVHRKAWQAAIDAGKADPVEPGDVLDVLPDLDWPPTDSRTGNFEERVVSQTRSLPSERKAEVARELLAEPEVAEAVADVIEEQVADSPAATARVNQKAEAKRPAPSRHEPKRSAMSAAASLTALEATAARLHDVVTDVVADVMDGQADPKLLAEPINSIGVDLQRLKIAAESSSSIDDALADLLNGDK